MPVVKAALLRERPDAVRELIRLLAASRPPAGLPGSGIDMLPFGVEACRPSLEILIRYCVEQHLIARAPSVDELFGSAVMESMQDI